MTTILSKWKSGILKNQFAFSEASKFSRQITMFSFRTSLYQPLKSMHSGYELVSLSLSFIWSIFILSLSYNIKLKTKNKSKMLKQTSTYPECNALTEDSALNLTY